MKKDIESAIARGEAAQKARIDAAAAEARRVEETRRQEAEVAARRYREIAQNWADQHLAGLVEERTAEGRREIDVSQVARNLKCWDDTILAEVVRQSGLKVVHDTREDCDYETGRGIGTYTTTYRAVW